MCKPKDVNGCKAGCTPFVPTGKKAAVAAATPSAPVRVKAAPAPATPSAPAQVKAAPGESDDEGQFSDGAPPWSGDEAEGADTAKTIIPTPEKPTKTKAAKNGCGRDSESAPSASKKKRRKRTGPAY